MKTLTAFNDTAIDSPVVDIVRLAKIEFSGLTLYLCDRVWGDAGEECVFNGQVYEPLVISWGTILHGKIDPYTYETVPSEAEFTLMNDVGVGGADDFTGLFSTYDPHYADVTISQIHVGASAAGDEIELFAGKLEDIINMSTDMATVVCSGLETAIANMFSHTIVDTTTYPGADPDDVGKMIPQVYGQAKRVPCIAVDAGGKSTITADITATVPGNSGSLVVSDGSTMPTGTFTLQVDSEQIRIASRSGNTLTLAAAGARGYGGTDAVAHDAGAPCAEIQTEYIYMAADHPVKAIDDVYVDNIRQVSGFVAYTGQTGDEHASYPGKAVIKFTTLPAYYKQVNVDADSSGLGVDSSGRSAADSGHEHTGSVEIATWLFDRAEIIGGTGVSGEEFICDGNASSGATSCLFSAANDEVEAERTFYQDFSGAPTHYRLCMSLGTIAGGHQIQMTFDTRTLTATSTDANTVKKGSWNAVRTASDTWAEINALKAQIKHTVGGAASNYVREAWLEFKYNPKSGSDTADVSLAGTNSVTGTVTLEGNSVADIVIGGTVSVDMDGWEADVSGDYGTSGTVIERPDYIIKHILIERCGLTSANIHSASYTAAGSEYNTNSYAEAVPILKRPNIRKLINRVARQARSIEFWEAGEHHLVFIPDDASESSDKTIEANRIDQNQIWVKYTLRARIQNTLSARYARNWCGYMDDVEADQNVVKSTDAGSVTKYGTLAGDQESYPYIMDATMAQDVLDRTKDDRKLPRLMVELVGGYYFTDVELGDVLDFTFTAGDVLDKALLGLVTSETTLFRVIEKNTRPDAAIQLATVFAGP